MAREPTARLSFRQRAQGGEVKTEPSEREYLQLACRRRLLLLIHGYNNDLQAGEEAYRGFEAMQRELADLDDDTPVAGGRLMQIYWPGDADWGIVSPLFYPWSIGRARETAAALADTLARAARESGHKQLDIVAHSMGCRLTLELLKTLRGKSDISVGRVVLMAGAVPTFMLEPRPDRHELREAYDKVLSEAGLSLYSSSDVVLSFAFPLGQSAATGEGFFPTALGHEFWADAVAPVNLTQKENPGADHSDYWGWKQKPRSLACAREANARIKEFLRFEQVGERTGAERETAERETRDERATGAARAPIVRDT
ncbi:MAG: alpha/beta hydrolase [Gammaproteobacteria bacterium]|nr:alpha/beta hydrolase [Gammaproteobacteria bacterium]